MFVPPRTPDWRDVCADAFGAMTGAVVGCAGREPALSHQVARAILAHLRSYTRCLPMREESLSGLTLQREGAVAVVTVNRPKVLNALNIATLDELAATMRQLQRDDDRTMP